MKTKLPFLAAALLLAAAPAFADDLLDAVLWDGPTAFPAKPAPAPTAPAVPSVPYAQPSPPAAPTPTELHLRRELQELRERTERMEAERQQQPPSEAVPETATPKREAPASDWTDWPFRPRFSLRGGVQPSSLDSIAASGELAVPLGEKPFDLAARAFYLFRKPEEFGNISEKTCYGGEAHLLFIPWRDAVLAPFAGIGIRYEASKAFREFVGDDEWKKDSGFSLVGRVGAAVTWKRLSLKGELIAASGVYELLGEVGVRAVGGFVPSVFIEHFDINAGGADQIIGVGFAILF